MANFATKIIEAITQWNDIFKVLKENIKTTNL